MSEPFALNPEIEVSSTFTAHFWLADKEYLVREYVDKGKSMNQIALDIGCARSTVGQLLAEYGVVRTGKSPPTRLGQIPYGLRLSSGQLVEHKAEAGVLKKIMAMREAGESYGKIVSWLNQKGIKTKNGRPKWDRPTVFKMIKRLSSTAHSARDTCRP